MLDFLIRLILSQDEMLTYVINVNFSMCSFPYIDFHELLAYIQIKSLYIVIQNSISNIVTHKPR